MTPDDITALQTALVAAGYPLVIDGRYGPATRAAYAQYLDRDATVPTVVPPAPIPWWQSKTAWFTLATIAASLAGLVGVDLDKQTLAETIGAAVTLATGIAALVANARRRAPIDNSLVVPGVRLAARAHPVSSRGDADSEHGPFGF